MSGTLYTWFRDTADRHPDEAGLEVAGTRLSYAELRTLADRLAAALTAEAADPLRTVALCASRSVAAYAGYLATLRCGATVVPLNVAAPAARNRAICDAAGVDLVIADRPGATVAVQLGRPVVTLTDDWAEHLPWSDPAGPDAGDPGEVAYILFTSGSTGSPKGVPIRHRQLVDYLPFCVERYGVGPGCRLSQTFDLTFDPSVFDMFVAWSSGATLVVPQPTEVLTPVRFVNEYAITHWFSVPSVISLVRRMHTLRPASMPNLRWSLFAGEQLTLDQARAWKAAAPGSAVENIYGPTELTITCTAYRLPDRVDDWPDTPNGTVPIGVPNPGLDAVLIDEHGRPGDAGELCMRGSQRFEGYLDPGDNDGRFVRGEADGGMKPVTGRPTTVDWYRTGDRARYQHGDLVHLGRLDDQVKIRGYRVEPGEIEHVLRQDPDVQDVVVLSVADGDGPIRLHALYCGCREAADRITEHARRRLPAYMVPENLFWVADFPANANGKIDRRRLRELVVALSGGKDARG